MKMYTMTDQDLLRMSNQVFSCVIGDLVKEGHLTNEQGDKIAENYSVIIENPSWLPEWLAKKLGLEKDTYIYRLVRAVGRFENK
jgi:hypothetical protein